MSMIRQVSSKSKCITQQKFCYSMDMKKPFLYASVTALYIAALVCIATTVGSFMPQEDNILMPMTILGVFVVSAAVMGFLFLSEPLRLFMENKRHEALAFFAKTVGVFACFVVLAAILVFLV